MLFNNELDNLFNEQCLLSILCQYYQNYDLLNIIDITVNRLEPDHHSISTNIFMMGYGSLEGFDFNSINFTKYNCCNVNATFIINLDIMHEIIFHKIDESIIKNIMSFEPNINILFNKLIRIYYESIHKYSRSMIRNLRN